MEVVPLLLRAKKKKTLGNKKMLKETEQETESLPFTPKQLFSFNQNHAFNV